MVNELDYLLSIKKYACLNKFGACHQIITIVPIVTQVLGIIECLCTEDSKAQLTNVQCHLAATWRN